MVKLIGVEDLQYLVKLVGATGFLKGHKPESLLLVGKYGVGKTSIIGSFSGKNLVFFTDLSSSGLIDTLFENSEITHVIIPDFTKVTQKNRNTSNHLIGTLNSMTEEGLFQIRYKNTLHNLEGRQVGLITATTDKSFNQNKKSWSRIGFTSRMLIASYSYSEETYHKIMEAIYNLDYVFKKNEVEPLKKNNGKSIKKIYVELPQELARKLNAKKQNSFRTQKQLQTLCCANALINDRGKVQEEDIEKIMQINKFLNLNYTKI